jgi:SAM-dependent methyltransferase
MTNFACRICKSPDHSLLLDYGRVALADAFLSSPQEFASEQTYPLTLVFCNACAHVQIKEIIDPEVLFSQYVWETGIPASIKEYCRTFADQVLGKAGLRAGEHIVEIASNDGTMLAEFKARGFNVLGVDPAKNIAEKAVARGLPTIADFFCERVARSVLKSSGRASLIVARNVLAHVADLHGLVGGIRLLLEPTGTAVIEVPHLLTTYRELQYDQVFHEHLGYHSLDSVCRLFKMHDLQVFEVDSTWIHGGSIRAYVKHAAESPPPSDGVRAVLEQEEEILTHAAWQSFAQRVREQKRLLRAELAGLVANGNVVVGYGASGKGQSMIQFCELDSSLVSCIGDKSALKDGKLCPGSHIPVVTPDKMRGVKPNVVVLFAWNFANEILEQERALGQTGTRFLHPIPSPHYL